MINNPIPLVEITTVNPTETSTNFITTYPQPITGKFYLQFDQSFTSSSNPSTFTRGSDAAVPMLTMTGGTVHVDMILQAINLKKLCIMPTTCNPYTFKVVRLYDPDRVVFVECLPNTSTPTTPTN